MDQEVNGLSPEDIFVLAGLPFDRQVKEAVRLLFQINPGLYDYRNLYVVGREAVHNLFSQGVRGPAWKEVRQEIESRFFREGHVYEFLKSYCQEVEREVNESERQSRYLRRDRQ